MRALVLAAGVGSRFKSQVPKPLHPIVGMPMIWHVLQTVKSANPQSIAIIVGHEAERIKAACGDGYIYFKQDNPKGGTGDAVLSAIDYWRDFDDYLLVINADTPLVLPQTIQSMLRYIKLVKEYENKLISGLLLSANLPDPTGYGRVIKEGPDKVLKIVEEKDASPEERAVSEVNSGVYIFYCPHLLETIFKLKPSAITNEVYLTEVFEIMSNRGYEVRAFSASDPTEVLGVNTRWDLAIVENVARLRILERIAKEGNSIHQPESVWVEASVEFGAEVEIFPDVTITGNTRISDRAIIGRGCIIHNSLIGEGAIIEPYSVIKDSTIKAGARVGPFAHIRNNSIIGEDSHIGNFVEVKSSSIGRQVFAKHLSYIGNATIEEKVNVGAGVVFANFDGKKKHECKVKRNAFIGSNSLIIAPIVIGEKAFIAGGSVVNKDIPDGALAISRPTLKIKEELGFKKLNP
ncbi:MAG: bifunctional UDP-N-acetylglucosamine diphosphorylase/glucosamine-1-phosphate N-acetyltransferase GlmU [Aquificaceae bacterium]|nr:bifunctional UDP-N-acetylglucosamine diphosphorylase/glucosamine-1-phosphate N-acetyltransferase GlmU [Aquificaceae bacterium]MDW8236901.1 bifunctional UDP-N-acetylglucosamine diphosphorylase/glucosamine-1-phosphate N-acetyltransferase GlmU [Aquificaceae bacterium]